MTPVIPRPRKDKLRRAAAGLWTAAGTRSPAGRAYPLKAGWMTAASARLNASR